MSASNVGEDVTVFDFIELLQASDWVSSPVYAGWLQKKSKGWFVSNLFTQMQWQPKWVSLHGLELLYMDEEPTHENIASIRIRRTSIGTTTKITPFDEDDRSDPLCFSIQPDCTKPRIWKFRADSEEEKTNWLIKISQVHAIAAWLDSYTKERVLGVGAQGTVYEIVHKSTGQRYALKEVNIENEKQMQMAITEAKTLKEITKNVCHPCIMAIEKVFQVVDKFYLVFPLCTGGELYEAVVRRGHFTERKAARIIRDVVSALQALHEHDILHLDIKPENILFESNEPNARVKITDFGLSRIFSDTADGVAQLQRTMPTDEELQARTESFINCGNFNADHVRGTFGYMSPELILSGYCSKASDVFAAGVILYILLCGYPPFNSKSVRQLFVRTVKGAYKLSGPEWDAISSDAKDLVRKMLDISPKTRITTYEILAHPWIKKAGDFDSVTEKGALGSDTTAGAARLSNVGNTELFSGLHGKSSVVHGNLLHGELLDASIASDFSYSTAYPHTASDVNLTRALDHLADHIKTLKSEKLAKTVTRLMIQKATSGVSKLAALYLVKVAPSPTSGTTSGSASSTSTTGKPPSPRPTSTRSLLALSMAPIQEEDGRAFSECDDGNSTPGGSTKSVTQFTEAEIAKLGDFGADTGDNRADFVPAQQRTPGPVTESGDKMDELQQMVNSESKEAVAAAMFAYFGAGTAADRLTTAQCILMLKRVGLLGANTNITSVEPTPSASPSGSSGTMGGADAASPHSNSQVTHTALASVALYGLLFSRFTDAQGKGYLTHEDFFTAQVLVLQNNELYLRALFKQYQHSLSYPGRQENVQSAIEVLNASLSVLNNHSGTSASAARCLMFEPPARITAKHVAAVFERYGFDPRNGKKVFNLLCDVLAKLKSERRHSSYGATEGNSPLEMKPDSSEDLTGTDAATLPLRIHDQMTSTAKVILNERVRSLSAHDLSLPQPPNNSSTSADKTSPSNVSPVESPRAPAGTSAFFAAPTTPSSLQRSMDEEEFIQIAKIDPILVDVFSKDAHARLFSLFQRVESRYLAERKKWDNRVDKSAEKMEAVMAVVKAEVAAILDDPQF